MRTLRPLDTLQTVALSADEQSRDAPGFGRRSDLSAVASSTEQDRRYWQTEFDWALDQDAVAALAGAAASSSPLTGEHLAAQHAVCLRAPGVPPENLEGELIALASRLAPRIKSGADVCIDLTSALRSGTCPEMLAAATALVLPSALLRHRVRARRLSFSFHVGSPAELALLELRHSAALGRPSILARLDHEFFLRLGNKDPDVEWLWGSITELAHRNRRVAVIPESPGRSPCALCGLEKPDTVLPGSRLEVRADTAWIALEVRLDRLFVAFHRKPDALRRLMRAGLRLLDNLPAQIHWPTRGLRRDAVVNRRLAIHLVGAGRLVDAYGLDPGDFTTLRRVTRWFTLLQRLAVRESAALAATRGPFAGLKADELVDALAGRYGHARAHELIRRRSLRHRHLVALSPFSLIPERDPRHPQARYLHLLPALRCADSLCTQGDGARHRLGLSEYRQLLRMAWALGRNR